MSYKVTFSTRWADFDPNNHMRHSSYNDYAAETRVRFFRGNGFSLLELKKNNIGPVLFSENTNFYREINLSEDIDVELFVKGLSENAERYKFLHKIYKQNGILAAEIEIFGAWIDLTKRKLTMPPNELISKLDTLEKADNFEIIQINKK